MQLNPQYRQQLIDDTCRFVRIPSRTISKQDSFILSNHAGIPTVAFGPAGNRQGCGANHEPDEYLLVDELWNAACISYHAITGWMGE